MTGFKEPYVDLVFPNGICTVVNFTDIQLCTRHWLFQGEFYQSLKNQVDFLIDKYKPDVLTVSGDLGYGHLFASYACSAFFEKKTLPWTFIFGNHDHEVSDKRLSRLQKIYQEKPHCLYRSGEPFLGLGNYTLRLTDKDGKIFRALIFIDAKEKGFVPQQVERYRKVISELKQKNGSVVPTTVVTHIPLPVFKTAWEGSCERSGYCHEKIHCQTDDFGLFEAILEEKSTDSVLVGHDHKNNFILTYKGIKLIYAQKTGISGKVKPEPTGGTVLIFDRSQIKVEQSIVSIDY